MTQNKNQLELPPIPEPPEMMPPPEGRAQGILIARDRTLGKLAITLEADALHFEDYVSKAQHAEDTAADLAANKRNPKYVPVGKIGMRIGQRRGTVMTDAESEFVEDVAMTVGGRTEYYSHEIQRRRERVPEEIGAIRDRLAELGESDVEILETYIESMASSELRQRKNTEERDAPTWAEWLTKSAKEDDVLAFLREHNEHIELHKADPETEHLIESQRKIYKTRVQELVMDGKLHPDALQALDRVNDIEVRIGDVFDTIIDDSHGYHIPGQKFIVVSGSASDGTSGYKRTTITADSITRTVPHELNHAVLGELGDRWLNEAVTELIAADIRSGEALAYPHEIGLLSEVLGEDRTGNVHVSAKQAYSEKSDSTAHEQFASSVLERWRDYAPEGATGHDILTSVDVRVAGYEKELIEKGVSLSRARSQAVLHARIDLRTNPNSVFTASSSESKSPSGEGLLG